jgi:hypothetical protein
MYEILSDLPKAQNAAPLVEALGLLLWPGGEIRLNIYIYICSYIYMHM